MGLVYLKASEIRKLDSLRDRIHDVAEGNIEQANRAAKQAKESIDQATMKKRRLIEKWRRNELKKLLEGALRVAEKRGSNTRDGTQ